MNAVAGFHNLKYIIGRTVIIGDRNFEKIKTRARNKTF